MKTFSTKERIAGGVDQRWEAPEETASNITNMRRDDTGYGWVNDRGWELESKPNANHFLASADAITKDRTRLYVWTRHRGSEVYKIYKRSDGYLFWEHNNTSGITSAIYPLAQQLNTTRRQMPKSDDPDEQYTPFGRFLTIINGKDIPLKFWGRLKVFPFGFTTPTPPPQLAGPDTDYFVGVCDLGADPPTSTYPPVTQGSIAVSFDGPAEAGGLGLVDNGKVNQYQYKVSFVTDTGSESPLSQAANISWTNPNPGQNRTYGVFIEHLPLGQPGVVARKIYRTKSLGDLRNDERDQQYYLVAQINDNCTINYLDVIPDDLLVTAAPSTFASSVISTSYRYSANWDNRMWLAGGQGSETKILYSEQGLPEQFPTFNYFDVGNRAGGSITQIFPYYDNLLVFREKAIDVVRPAGNGTYVCTRLSGDIGTTASNTITNVEGEGVFFLTYDGVYVFSGGTIGGSSVRLKRISDTIQKEINRISKSSLARATASYSHKEKEWWCFFPVDGETDNTRSIVYHTLGQVWSFRNSLGSQQSYSMVNDLATLPDGRFIAACKNQVFTNFPAVNDTTSYPGGLVVWAGGRKQMPGTYYGLQQGTPVISGTFPGAEIVSEWMSSWEDFGDDSVKKRILSVEVDVLTAGNNQIELLYGVDNRDDFTSAGLNPTSVAELYGTPNSDAIYTGTTLNTFDKSPLVANQTRWGQRRTTRIRWDVNTNLVSWFAFKLVSSNLFQVVSYQIELMSGERKTINMKAGERKT